MPTFDPPPSPGTTPLAVAISDNLSGIANRATTAVVYTLAFSEAVTGLETNDFSITNGVVNSVSGNGSSWMVSITPALGVASGTIGLMLKAGAVSDIVGTLNASATDTSQAIDTLDPTVNSANPADEAANVTVIANIVFVFSEPIAKGTGSIALKTATGITIATYDAATSANLSISGSTLTINPTSDLSNGTGYKVEFAAGTIKDLAGNSYAGTTSYNFTTATNGYEAESNDSVATANTLALSTPIIGQVLTVADVDYYKVTVGGAGLLSLTVDVPTSSSLDMYKLGLYSYTGTLLAAFTTGKDQTFQTPVTVAGDYYVGIGSSTYYSYESSAVNQYTLTASSAAGATTGYEAESNDSVATANTLALSTPIIGQVLTVADVDYYKVTVGGAGLLSLTVDVPTSSSLDMYKLGLYSYTGTLLAAFTTGKDQTFQTPVTVAGDYYVRVETGSYYKYESAAVNQYALTTGFLRTNSLPTGSVTVTGTPTQGQILTVSNTLADTDGLGTISYQWKAAGVIIAGATANSYTLTQADVGKVITVNASYTDAFGTAESKISIPTLPVAATSGLTGSTGNDSLTGSTGSDTIDGGAGVDTAVYSISRSNFALSKTATGFTLTDNTGVNGTDTLLNVERLKFSDGAIALDVGASQPAGQTAMLLGAVLPGRLAFDSSKQALLGAAIDLFDQGFRLQTLSGAVMRLPIWDILTQKATPTNTDIATYLLTNVNGVAPDATTLTNAVTALNTETDFATQGNFLWHLAESATNQTRIDLVGLSSTGLAYGS